MKKNISIAILFIIIIIIITALSTNPRKEVHIKTISNELALKKLKNQYKEDIHLLLMERTLIESHLSFEAHYYNYLIFSRSSYKPTPNSVINTFGFFGMIVVQ